MENRKTNKTFFIVSKYIDETTSLDLKDFFSETNRYLDNKSKFILGDKNLIRIKKPLMLKDKIKNNSKNGLIDKKNNENNINNNFKNEEKAKNIFSKFKKYYNKNYKQKVKYKSPCSLLVKTKEENKDNKENDIKTIKFNNRILYRNKSNLENIMKNNLEKSLSFRQSGIHYELKTKKEIIDLFQNYMNNVKCKALSKKKLNRFPKKKVSFNEIMKNDEEEKKNFEIFSNFLSKKCKRKNLLVNKIDDFNYKKYMSNYLEDNKILSERLGNNFWICDLRRNKNENKINYVVTGKLDKEPWEQIIGGSNEPEFVSDPSVSQTRLKNFNRAKAYKTFIKNYPSLKFFHNIKIEGKNLLEKELNNFSNNNRDKNENIKYRLYKDPRELKDKFIKDIVYKQNFMTRSKSTKNAEKKGAKFNI